MSYINQFIGTDDNGWPTGSSLPYSYRLSISDHGIAVCIWYEAQEPFGECFSWFVVQRPVHPKTGVPLLRGKCPVFCLYSLQGGGVSNGVVSSTKVIRAFTVREVDVNTPGLHRNATRHTKYGSAVINPFHQISFTEDNEYIVSFPNNLTTDRYAYIHEMDMIGYCSAGVISQWTIAELNMYSEKMVATPPATGYVPYKRRYQALQANEPLNHGMRILFLIEGGGIQTSSPPVSLSIGIKDI
jgi:hypothetical protein